MAKSSTLHVPSPPIGPVHESGKLRAPGPGGASPVQRVTMRTESQDWCGRGCLVGVTPDLDKVFVFPAVCHTWDCKRCGPIKRHFAALRIASGKPDKFITITGKKTPDSTPRRNLHLMKDAWPKLVKCIKREFGDFEYALVWELDKQGFPH
ncbi:unnamed protein product, partial [marine sediment metagenome]